MASIGDRLQETRRQVFVGRTEEVERFRSAVTAEILPFHVLHVFGPGGIGKTELLRSFERACDEIEVSAHYLDVRDVDPSPDALRSALREVLDVDDDRSVMGALSNAEERVVLLLDTVETIEPLDDWMRSDFVPALPEHVVVVMAGRDEPTAEWRADAGWGELVETMPLRNFDTDAGRALLRARDVPADQHETILNFTHGHPLATSLVADLMEQRDEETFVPEEAPDVVKTLLEQFVQKVPGPAHRATLEAAALVRYTTEALLRSVLETPDAHELFEWLRGLSFVRPGARGLVLHELAREALVADLRWRNPEWHDTLHERARAFYTDRLKQGADRRVPDALSDFTFLLRDHPLLQPFYRRLQSQWREASGLIEDRAEDDDWPLLVDMVRAHEGDEAARIAEHWFERQPEGVRVYRNDAGDPAGFMLTLSIEKMSADDRAADPVVSAAGEHLEAHAPLRADERASLFRFWMDRDSYQAVSPVQSLIFIRQVRHYLQTPNLAYTFVVCRDGERWTPLFTYADMAPLLDEDPEVGPHRYRVYGHDWRAVPPAQWLDRLADRGFDAGPDAASDDEDRVIVLSRSDFEDALREAFKALHRPDQLGDNPLLYSRLVTREAGREAGQADRVEVLTRRLEEAVDQLAADPRDEKYHRAVHRTYIQPAPTQEKAAERLGIPFSTFRRHLNRGLARVADMLWNEEVGAEPQDPLLG